MVASAADAELVGGPGGTSVVEQVTLLLLYHCSGFSFVPAMKRRI